MRIMVIQHYYYSTGRSRWLLLLNINISLCYVPHSTKRMVSTWGSSDWTASLLLVAVKLVFVLVLLVVSSVLLIDDMMMMILLVLCGL